MSRSHCPNWPRQFHSLTSYACSLRHWSLFIYFPISWLRGTSRWGIPTHIWFISELGFWVGIILIAITSEAVQNTLSNSRKNSTRKCYLVKWKCVSVWIHQTYFSRSHKYSSHSGLYSFHKDSRFVHQFLTVLLATISTYHPPSHDHLSFAHPTQTFPPLKKNVCFSMGLEICSLSTH